MSGPSVCGELTPYVDEILLDTVPRKSLQLTHDSDTNSKTLCVLTCVGMHFPGKVPTVLHQKNAVESVWKRRVGKLYDDRFNLPKRLRNGLREIREREQKPGVP